MTDMKPIRLVYERWEHTVPNFITLFRLLVCLWGIHLFYWYVFLPPMIVLLCFVSAVLDGVDGYAARKLNQESFSGKLLDPLVDKICCWNATVVIAHYFATHADWMSFGFALLALPPVLCIGLYDYATMSMRSTDENMTTSDEAKRKQGTLFAALGLFLVAMSFAYAASGTEDSALRTSMHATYALFLLGGMLALWQALRMTAQSTRTYFATSKDPRAKDWARKPIVAFVLSTV